MQENERKKKPYEPPSITQFPLKPQEAALGFCKTNRSGGPGSASCRIPTSCSSIGS
jgi:hypothetical protein